MVLSHYKNKYICDIVLFQKIVVFLHHCKTKQGSYTYGTKY